MSEPKLLLIDEPSAGLAPLVVEQLFETLRAIAEGGMTMLLVEQNVTFGLKLVDTAHILQMGRIVYEGATASLDRQQVANYLGIGRLGPRAWLGSPPSPAQRPASALDGQGTRSPRAAPTLPPGSPCQAFPASRAWPLTANSLAGPVRGMPWEGKPGPGRSRPAGLGAGGIRFVVGGFRSPGQPGLSRQSSGRAPRSCTRPWPMPHSCRTRGSGRLRLSASPASPRTAKGSTYTRTTSTTTTGRMPRALGCWPTRATAAPTTASPRPTAHTPTRLTAPTPTTRPTWWSCASSRCRAQRPSASP